jgi:folylpolyglutamate synthase/dihydropteroate synthase
VAEALVDAGARNVVCAETPSEALLLTRDEPTVVVGSLYLVGDVLAALGAQAEDLRVFE